jgi:hypothetical protein
VEVVDGFLEFGVFLVVVFDGLVGFDTRYGGD